MIMYGFTERLTLEMRYARGEITEHEYVIGMLELTHKMRKHLMLMEMGVAIVAFVVCGGLALLALRLGTFS